MVFERDSKNRVFHLTAKAVLAWIVTFLTIISLAGGISYSMINVGTKFVHGYDTMSHAIEQNTTAVSHLGRQMAANLQKSGHQIDKVAEQLSHQISALSRRTDNIQDRTRVLEITQARVLEALKREGITSGRD